MKSGISVFFIMFITLTMLFGYGSQAAAVEVGLAWSGKSGMADRVAAGFEKGIKELAPQIKVEYQKDLASMDDLAQTAAAWGKTKKGMVLIRSNAAEWLGSNKTAVPTFIGGCNHPGTLGAIRNLNAPEGNITGVTYYLPHETQFEIFTAILPDMKSVLLLLGQGNPSTMVDQEGTKAACAKRGISYNEKFCTTVDEMVRAVNEFKGRVSAIIIGNQAIIMDNTVPIVAAAGKTPVVSFSNDAVKKGALCGFVADDEKLGYMLAESVVDVLVKGKAVKDVPVKVDPDPIFFLNSKTAQNLGIEVPYDILSTAKIIE
ncbi:MAG: ABC transporter substrate binding protein [Pseudomonadota bacterium]